MKTRLLKKLRRQARERVRVVRDGLGYQIQYMFHGEWDSRNYDIRTYDEAVSYYHRELDKQLRHIVYMLRQMNPKIVEMK